MNDVHDITSVKKSWKLKLPSKKTAAKAAALTTFVVAAGLVAYDKLTHSSSDSDTETSETD